MSTLPSLDGVAVGVTGVDVAAGLLEQEGLSLRLPLTRNTSCDL